MGRVGVAILETVIVFGFSYLFDLSKKVNMGRVGVAILETVIVFGFSYLFGMSTVSTVTGMGRVGVAILETVIIFGFSCLLGMSKVSTVTGMRRAPPKRKKTKKIGKKNQKNREKNMAPFLDVWGFGLLAAVLLKFHKVSGLESRSAVQIHSYRAPFLG